MVWISEKQLAGYDVSGAIIFEEDFCVVTLREITLVLVLKNLRLVKGCLTILKREQGFTVWLGMEKLPVQIKTLLKNLWRILKTLWIERDLFPNEY